MPWTTYKSTDASAPTLNGTAGSLITVLDAVLVNGYGAKAAAGWTKEFSGTNKAAYRNASGSISRTYLRVQDDGPGSHGGREARLRLYSTMSDVDTGTLPTPTVAQSTPGIVARKSTTADATARVWTILADEKTCILILQSGDTSGGFTDVAGITYAGDIYAYLPADAQGAFIGGRIVEANSSMTPTAFLLSHQQYAATSVIAGYIAGSHTGVAGSLPLYLTQPTPMNGIYGSFAHVAYPNAADGAVYIVGPMLAYVSGGTIRGHLRGISAFCHIRTSINAGDTVTGTGDLTGRTFVLHPTENPSASSGAPYQMVYAFETSTPPASS